MIKVKNINVWGWEHSIRGMRNPLASWSKSDSYRNEDGEFVVGDADLALMRKLCAAGPEHRKFMRQIFVSMDITAPMYWYLEFDTYHVGVTSDSCSKMHKLLAKPFEMEDFSFEKLFGYKREIKQFRPEVDVADEEWKQSLEDYYVSDCGRIYHKTGKKNKLLCGSLHQDGYIFVTIKGKQYPLHRLIAKAFIPNPDNLPQVNHKDGNKQNNFASNLEWCTASQNIIHSVKNNLQPYHLAGYTGKFTKEQRQQIKDEYNNTDISKRELAIKWGVSHTCISNIISGTYRYMKNVNLYEKAARPIVDCLNELRDSYLSSEDEAEKRKIWYSILQLLPESYNQKRTVTFNYENAHSMIHQRENHRLDEWREFVEVLKELPYMQELLEVEK